MKRDHHLEPAGKALTMGELRAFIDETSEVPDDATPTVRIAFGGGVKRITVTEEVAR